MAASSTTLLPYVARNAIITIGNIGNNGKG